MSTRAHVSGIGGRRLRLVADDRRIIALAAPALGALAAEPLYVLVDTVIVGHLGVRPLATLALAGAMLSAVVNLCKFLAYGSTPAVGRLHASGDSRIVNGAPRSYPAELSAGSTSAIRAV